MDTRHFLAHADWISAQKNRNKNRPKLDQKIIKLINLVFEDGSFRTSNSNSITTGAENSKKKLGTKEPNTIRYIRSSNRTKEKNQKTYNLFHGLK